MSFPRPLAENDPGTYVDSDVFSIVQRAKKWKKLKIVVMKNIMSKKCVNKIYSHGTHTRWTNVKFESRCMLYPS